MIRAISAALIGATLVSATSVRAETGPGFVLKTLHSTDVQYSLTPAPDYKALSVLFDNLAVNLFNSEDAPPVASRVFPLSIPVKNAGQGALLTVDVRGAAHCSAPCLVMVWVNGQTKVLDYSVSRASNFTSRAQFALPGAEIFQTAVILIADRATKETGTVGKLTVDSLDFTIAPPAPESGGGK